MGVGQEQIEQLRQQLKHLRESGEDKLSTTDPEARFLRERGGGFVLGYTAEIAVSEDHFIVAQRVTQNKNDNHACFRWWKKWSGNAGSVRSGYWPTADFSRTEFAGDGGTRHGSLSARSEYGPRTEYGKNAPGVGRMRVSDPHLLRARQRLRSVRGRAWYKKRKGMVEPVFGTLKEQRGMRQFERRGPEVAVEWALASIAYNLMRYRNLRRTA